MGDHRWQEPTDDECRKLLGERHLGRLALVDADGLVILPVNYTLDEGSVVFRTDPGSKLDAAAAGATVAVTGQRIALPADLPFTWWG